MTHGEGHTSREAETRDAAAGPGRGATRGCPGEEGLRPQGPLGHGPATAVTHTSPGWGPGLPEPTLVHPADGGVLSSQVSSGGRGVGNEVRHLGDRWVGVKARPGGLGKWAAAPHTGTEDGVLASLPGPEATCLPSFLPG